MATVGMLLQRSVRFVPKFVRHRKVQQMFVRHETNTPTGAMLGNPVKNRFGLSKVVIVIVPTMYIGATMSKEGAAFLEENDIFVPEDDDD